MEIIRGKRQNSTLGHYSMEMPYNPKIKIIFREKVKRKLFKLKGMS